jgi:hypothetical protein
MKSPCFPDPQNFTVGSDSSIRQYTSVPGRTNFGLAWLKADVTFVYSGSWGLFTVPAVHVGAGQQGIYYPSSLSAALDTRDTQY